MKKPASLRATLLERTPWLQHDPNRLAMFVESGSVVAVGDDSFPTSSLSYENEYKLTLVVLDFPGDPQEIKVPILEWLQTHQPDLIRNKDWQRTGFSFEVEVIDSELYDLSITLQLTERMIAKVKNKEAVISAERYLIETADEPQYDELLAAINGVDPMIDPTRSKY